MIIFLKFQLKTDKKTIPHADGQRALSMALDWLNEQPEATPYNLSVLQSLKELAASKRLECLKQPKIQSFFANK